MKTLKRNKLPRCSFCGNDAIYDGPSNMGPWAYYCREHYETHANKQMTESMGCKLELRGPKKPSVDGVLQGIESNDEVYLEGVCMGDENREIECPNCGDGRDVEPDACYTYTCEGCGSRIKVPALI